MSRYRTLIVFLLATLMTLLADLTMYILSNAYEQKVAVYTAFGVPVPHEIPVCAVLMLMVQSVIWVAWMRILEHEEMGDGMEEGESGYQQVVGNGESLGYGVGLGIMGGTKQTHAGDFYGYGYGNQGYGNQGYGGGYREVMDGRGVRRGG